MREALFLIYRMSKTIATIIILLLVCETANAYLRIGLVYRPGQMLSSNSKERMRRDLGLSLIHI